MARKVLATSASSSPRRDSRQAGADRIGFRVSPPQKTFVKGFGSKKRIPKRRGNRSRLVALPKSTCSGLVGQIAARKPFASEISLIADH